MLMTVSIRDLEQSGSSLAGDCGYPSYQPPPWLDMDKFRRGRRFFQRHLLSFQLMLHFSLVVGFSLINLLEPLVFTRRSDTPEKALKRYMDTFHHIALWHIGDVWEAPLGKAHKALLKVRKMHGAVAKAMQKSEPGKTPVSQYDMALVQSGFFGAAVLYPESFGIQCSRDDLDDYVHFWRGMGYLLGIRDDHNLCTWGYDTTCKLVKEIEQDLIAPASTNLPKDFTKMCDAYITATNPKLVPLFSKETMFALFYDAAGFPVPKLGLADNLRWMFFRWIVYMIRWCPGFETTCNTLIRFAVNRELKQFVKTF